MASPGIRINNTAGSMTIVSFCLNFRTIFAGWPILDERTESEPDLRARAYVPNPEGRTTERNRQVFETQTICRINVITTINTVF